MSGNDIIAVLCLLLAGGGLAYLVRSSRKGKDASVPEEAENLPSRTAQTIPPKLRSPSSQPSLPPSHREDPPSAPAPKASESSAGSLDRPEKKKKHEGKRNPGSFTASPIKATLVSSATDEIAKIAERAAERKVEVTTAPPVKAAAAVATPASTPKPTAPASTPKPAAPIAKKAEPAKTPEAAKKAEPTKAEPAKAEPTKAEPAKAEPTKAEPTRPY